MKRRRLKVAMTRHLRDAVRKAYVSEMGQHMRWWWQATLPGEPFESAIGRLQMEWLPNCGRVYKWLR